MGSVPIELDWEKLILLLDRFEHRSLSREEAVELEPLLLKYYEKALVRGDRKLTKKISIILFGLNGYVSGDISESDYRRLSNV